MPKAPQPAHIPDEKKPPVNDPQPYGDPPQTPTPLPGSRFVHAGFP